MFDVLHTVINSVYVQIANRASHHSCNRFFSWGYDKPSGPPLKAQTDGPEETLRNYLTYRRDVKEKKEYQPRNGKMT